MLDLSRPVFPQETDPENGRLDALARRALQRCDVLADFSEEPSRLTRTFLSAAMRGVHESLGGWMEAAGMRVRMDALGNLVGRYADRQAGAAAPERVLILGSHLDTVPDAGRYDGVLGVLLALAAVESLEGRLLPFAVDVIGFSEEEGIRFQKPYLGSLAASGQFDPGLLALQDSAGVTMAKAIRAFGQNPADATQGFYDPALVVGYFEAHIEQGPVLEDAGLPLGIVEAIAGQTRLRLQFLGQAGHAGTTPMGLRRDALAGAAEFVLAVEAVGRDVPGLTATVGAVSVAPNASNVIPGMTEVTLDVRHADDTVRRRAVGALLAQAGQNAAGRSLTLRVMGDWDEPAVALDEVLRRRLASAMAAAGVPEKTLVSGAGHDAVVMARMTGAAMLFLRSPGGLSHHPNERVIPDDVTAALRVMRHFLLLTAQGEEARSTAQTQEEGRKDS